MSLISRGGLSGLVLARVSEIKGGLDIPSLGNGAEANVSSQSMDKSRK
jgi:hypothetical protein